MKKILIIDDEYIILQGLKHLLDWRQHGYDLVLETQSPQTALDYINKHHVDIVLSDIVMPEMSGLELLQRIKHINPKIHVVIISSHSDFEYTRQALRYGASDYILKTLLKPELVLNVIDELEVVSNPSDGFDYKKVLSEDLLSYINHPDALPDVGQYFKYPYFSIIMDDAIHEHPFADKIHNYLHLTIETPDVQVIILNTPEPFKNTPTDVTAYKFNLDSLEDLSRYHSIYSVQKELRFYQPDTPFELDLNFAWKLRPPFASAEFIANPKPSQFYNLLDQLYVYTSDVLKVQEYSPLELKSFVSNSLYQMMTQIEKQNIDTENASAFKLQMIYQIQNAKDYQDFKFEFNTILSNLSIIIQSYLNQDHSDFKNQMSQYLEENYKNNIGLDDIAQHFNFSYYYMSEIFNNHFDASFNDVLNKIRIEKAIELLDQAHLSLQEIATSVGYTNYSHFSKLFKKHQFISPSEYRQDKL